MQKETNLSLRVGRYCYWSFATCNLYSAAAFEELGGTVEF
jgi:hypothetical protein